MACTYFVGEQQFTEQEFKKHLASELDNYVKEGFVDLSKIDISKVTENKKEAVKKAVTKAGEKVIKALQAKGLNENDKIQGISVRTLVESAVKAIHKAIDLGVGLKEAVQKGIDYLKEKKVDNEVINEAQNVFQNVVEEQETEQAKELSDELQKSKAVIEKQISKQLAEKKPKTQQEADKIVQGVLDKVRSHKQLLDELEKEGLGLDQFLNDIKVDFEVEEKPIEAKKPKQKQPTEEKQEKPKEEATQEQLDNFKLSNSQETKDFISGKTWEDIFGDKPQNDQTYIAKTIEGMLEDGKAIIDIAKEMWGDNVRDYAPKLFEYAKSLNKDESSNKKVIILATLLGEIKEEIERNPKAKGLLLPIQNEVFNYYQNYMRSVSLDLNAGRILRLYRDKYLGDIYAEKILEEKTQRARTKIKDALNRNVTQQAVDEAQKPITQEEKQAEDKRQTETVNAEKEKQGKKPKMKIDEASRLAKEKLKEINAKLKDSDNQKKGLIEQIKEKLKDCK